MVKKGVKFFKRTLENGMTVILEQRKGSRVVSVGFAVKFGGVNENPEEKGIAHFIEHMLYKGTYRRNAKQISEEIEKNGGVLNGFTDEELTAFWCKIPSKHVDIALDVIGDMVRNPKFDSGELEKERKVIFEEIKMRKDTPQIYVYDRIQTILYSGDLSRNLIGTEKTLLGVNREKMSAKFREIYNSGNMFLIAVGDCDFKVLCDYCLKNFSKASGKIREPNFSKKNSEVIEKRKGIDQANLIFAYHNSSALEKENYVSQVFNCIMAGGMSSRLFQEIREKRNLAYSVRGSVNLAKRFGYTSIYIGTSEKDVFKLKKLILEEFKKFIKEGSEKELGDAKEQLVGNSLIGREDSQGQMNELFYNSVWGKPRLSYEFEKNIRKVKLSEVKNFARKILKDKNYSFFGLIPERA